MTRKTVHPTWVRHKNRNKQVVDGGQIPAAPVPFMPSVRVNSKGEVISAVPQDDDKLSSIYRLGAMASYRVNLDKAIEQVDEVRRYQVEREVRACTEWAFGRLAVASDAERACHNLYMPSHRWGAEALRITTTKVEQYLMQRRFPELLHFTVDTYIRYGETALHEVLENIKDHTLNSAYGRIVGGVFEAGYVLSYNAWYWSQRNHDTYQTFNEYLDYVEQELNKWVKQIAETLHNGVRDAEETLEYGPPDDEGFEGDEEEESPDPPIKRKMEDLKEVERFKFKNVASELGFEELRRLPLELDRTWPGLLSRKRIPADSGRKPRRYNRALVDGRIFDARTKALGGIVIIDWSGSMSLPASAVEQMFLASPGCVVAAYGYGRTYNFAVLAQRGRRTSTDLSVIRKRLGGGNGVDGPALVWAVEQRRYYNEPIIWVSDGCVTGKHENTDSRLYHYCAALVHNYNIYQALTIGEGVDLVQKLAKRDHRANAYRGVPRGGLEGYGGNVSKFAWFKQKVGTSV